VWFARGLRPWSFIYLTKNTKRSCDFTFHGSDHEEYFLPDVTPYSLLKLQTRLAGTYCVHLQGQNVGQPNKLAREAVCLFICSFNILFDPEERSVNVYHFTRCHIPEDSAFQQILGYIIHGDDELAGSNTNILISFWEVRLYFRLGHRSYLVRCFVVSLSFQEDTPIMPYIGQRTLYPLLFQLIVQSHPIVGR
jgi:hypothetical protein